eukprot:1766414-Amphidinium_carterae.3
MHASSPAKICCPAYTTNMALCRCRLDCAVQYRASHPSAVLAEANLDRLLPEFLHCTETLSSYAMPILHMSCRFIKIPYLRMMPMPPSLPEMREDLSPREPGIPRTGVWKGPTRSIIGNGPAVYSTEMGVASAAS